MTAGLAGHWNDLLALVRDHLSLAAPIAFALGLGESIPVISLLIPSTVLFLAIGALHSSAGGEFLPVWLAGSGGAFAGDIAAYAMGHTFRDHIERVWPFSSRPHWHERARTFCHHWGAPGVIGSKFTAGVRPIVPVMAGAMSMPVIAFLLASALSCLIWAGVFLAPGYGITLFTQ